MIDVAIARLKQSGKILIWIVPLAVMFVVMVIAGIIFFSKRKRLEPSSSGIPGKIAQGINEVLEKVTEANIQAKIEIAAARTKDKTVKVKITSILASKDAALRRRQLIALHDRMDQNP